MKTPTRSSSLYSRPGVLVASRAWKNWSIAARAAPATTKHLATMCSLIVQHLLQCSVSRRQYTLLQCKENTSLQSCQCQNTTSGYNAQTTHLAAVFSFFFTVQHTCCNAPSQDVNTPCYNVLMMTHIWLQHTHERMRIRILCVRSNFGQVCLLYIGSINSAVWMST